MHVAPPTPCALTGLTSCPLCVPALPCLHQNEADFKQAMSNPKITKATELGHVVLAWDKMTSRNLADLLGDKTEIHGEQKRGGIKKWVEVVPLVSFASLHVRCREANEIEHEGASYVQRSQRNRMGRHLLI